MRNMLLVALFSARAGAGRVRAGLVLVFVAGLWGSSGAFASCSAPPSGLISWWPADGNANDLSGTNNGVLAGTASASAAGYVGTAFSFDGTNSYVQVPDSSSLHPTNLTVEAWVLFTGLDSAGSGVPAGAQFIVFKQNVNHFNFEGFYLGKTRIGAQDKFTFQVTSSAGVNAELDSTTVVTTNTWYHVAGVRGTNFIQLYVNGQLQGKTNVTFAQSYGTFPLYFGTSGQGYWNRLFRGLLDEVSLYNRALSSNEIAAIYAAGSAGKCNSLALTQSPQDQTVAVGSNALFAVQAWGSPPLGYQWQHESLPIPGATGTNLVITNAEPADAGHYVVIVTNFSVSVTSAPALLTVVADPPVITQEPAPVIVLAGSDVLLSAAASGTPPLSYEWQRDGVDLADGGEVSGISTPTLELLQALTNDTGAYRLIVTNSLGAATSLVAKVTVLLTPPPPTITAQPASLAVTIGSPASFTVGASGLGQLTYQWAFNGAPLSGGGQFSGTTNATLRVAGAQLPNSGPYSVVVANAGGFVTSAIATLTVTPSPPLPATALVLVNSQSSGFLDFQHFIQPYLDTIGVPYSVADISTNAGKISFGHYPLLIIGHRLLDTNGLYLTAALQTNLSLAISNGTGLVNFDNALSTPAQTGRYRFVQDLFGFGYGGTTTCWNFSMPPTEPGATMHYITGLHDTNDFIPLRSSMPLPTLILNSNSVALANNSGTPLVIITKYGQGRAVQWASYNWMAAAIRGQVDGLDDLVWRGMVWAARKPFAIRGMPHFVSFRIDDVQGPFPWIHDMVSAGMKPFVALFYSLITETDAADLRGLVAGGNVTTSIHSFDPNNLFYFDYTHLRPYSDAAQSNNFYLGTQWHLNHGIPISKVCATHLSAIGSNAFAGLKQWGMEYVPMEVIPGSLEYVSPYAPWLVGGPYRLYDTPQAGQAWVPTYYADWLSVPGHPEFDGQFFNFYCEIRDVTNTCDEWCPDNNVAASVDRASRMARRALDSMVMSTVHTHERYVSSVTRSNWQATLSGINAKLAPYNPIYVTVDFTGQYARATRTSRLLDATLDPLSGFLTLTFAGKTDLDMQVYVFTGQDEAITNSLATIAAFSAGSTNTVPGLSVAPMVLAAPMSRTNSAGSPASFRVVAAGTPPLSYQWFFNSTNLLSDNANVSGAASDVLTFDSVSGADAGAYTVLITNAAGSVTSSPPALLTVVAPDPPRLQLLIGILGGFTISITGSAGTRYCLQATTNLVDWTDLISDRAPFTFTDTAGLAARFYRCVYVR